MKITLGKNDWNEIEKINQDLKEEKKIPLLITEKGERFFLEFTCEDVAKANAFIRMFLNPNIESKEELKDIFGITTRCINYCYGDSKKEELKRYLQSFLQGLERM